MKMDGNAQILIKVQRRDYACIEIYLNCASCSHSRGHVKNDESLNIIITVSVAQTSHGKRENGKWEKFCNRRRTYKMIDIYATVFLYIWCAYFMHKKNIPRKWLKLKFHRWFASLYSEMLVNVTRLCFVSSEVRSLWDYNTKLFKRHSYQCVLYGSGDANQIKSTRFPLRLLTFFFRGAKCNFLFSINGSHVFFWIDREKFVQYSF